MSWATPSATRPSVPPFFLGAAGTDEVTALLRIEALCFSHPWSRAMFEEAVSRPALGRLLLLRTRGDVVDEGILGYCAFRTVGDEAEIHTLAVAPGHRRLGLGRRLLRLTLERALRRGARAVLLEVRQSNRPAISLYRSQGFATVGVRRGYYTAPPEDAVLLRKSLENGRSAC
jgi:ribosomal-protein-alanine N-acetyltransferase